VEVEDIRDPVTRALIRRFIEREDARLARGTTRRLIRCGLTVDGGGTWSLVSGRVTHGRRVTGALGFRMPRRPCPVPPPDASVKRDRCLRQRTMPAASGGTGRGIGDHAGKERASGPAS